MIGLMGIFILDLIKGYFVLYLNDTIGATEVAFSSSWKYASIKTQNNNNSQKQLERYACSVMTLYDHLPGEISVHGTVQL